MKKLVLLLSFFILLLTGCVGKNNSGIPAGGNGNNSGNQSKNAKMTAIVKSISYKNGKMTSLLVLDEKNAEFVFVLNEKVDFKESEKLKTGYKLEIEHSGEIRESYPAQGTALKITILDSKASEAVDQKLYSVLPIRGGYSDSLFEKSMNSLRVFTEVLDSKAEFDKYMTDINFKSENKINLRAKYDDTFFKTRKLIFIAKSTSSTPSFAIDSLTKAKGKLTVVIEEKTSEAQTMDIVLKGFLVEVDASLLNNNETVNIEYLYKVVTK